MLVPASSARLRRSVPRPQTRFPRRRGFQRALFCACGQPLGTCPTICRACAWRIPYSRKYFGGQRAPVLERDGKRCRTCGTDHLLHVHHRRPGVHEPNWLVTLCAGCHARVHRLQTLRAWLPNAVLRLWEEQHPTGPRQLQFDWESVNEEKAAA